MAANNSLVSGDFLHRHFKVLIAQLLVLIFICINFWLIVTFFKKECFYTTTRYILFAVTLMSNSLLLLISDILLLLTYFQFTSQVWLCIIPYIALLLYFIVTPVTLTAMTLERYVAICMPLRHGELCSTRNTVYCILIIHGVSSVPCIIVLSTFFASASLSLHTQYRICSKEMFILYTWQGYLRSSVDQFYFLMMCIVIVFAYVKIMKVAKAASGEDKTSTWKGVTTVILHTFQLILRLISLWCPFIENAVFHINLRLFIDVRYFNYITFNLGPRCLSPLVYGLRDEKFFHALKNSQFFG